MPQDDDTSNSGQAEPVQSKSTSAAISSPSWLKTPQFIKRVFDKFPLQTYPSNELPQRAAKPKSSHSLYIFTTAQGAEEGRPSFNPGCLRWQAYLRFQGLDFVTVHSNNHASPSGALPFLLPAATSFEPPTPIPSNRIQPWTREVKAPKNEKEGKHSADKPSETQRREKKSGSEGESTDSADMRYEAYISLLDYRIRNAYLYALYISPDNYASVAFPLYIQPITSNYLVRMALSYQLRKAAEAELLKQSPMIDMEALYREGEKAFSALSELLGEDHYFFGEAQPGLFDASVFAYTHILLDEGMVWKDKRIIKDLEKWDNLVRHREKILEEWF